jgi:hypothetical protein
MVALAYQSRSASLKRKHIIPFALGLAMLAVIVASILAPNAGGVPPGTSGPPSTSVSFSWAKAGLAALVVFPGGLLAIFLVGRRRPSTTSPPSTRPSQGHCTPRFPHPEVTVKITRSAASVDVSRETVHVMRYHPSDNPFAISGGVRTVVPGGVATGSEELDLSTLSVFAEIDDIQREMRKRNSPVTVASTPVDSQNEGSISRGELIGTADLSDPGSVGRLVGVTDSYVGSARRTDDRRGSDLVARALTSARG